MWNLVGCIKLGLIFIGGTVFEIKPYAATPNKKDHQDNKEDLEKFMIGSGMGKKGYRER